MNDISRAVIFSYSDSLYYYAGSTKELKGNYNSVNFLKSADGKLLKFPSLYRAKEALINLGFAHCWLVMHSPYDEMIGNEPAQNTELFIPFTPLGS